MSIKFLQKLRKKKVTLIIFCIILLSSGYYFYHRAKSQEVQLQYITALAEKGTLTVSVSGTGQVSNSNQIDVKPQVSGKAIRVAVQSGQKVASNAILVQLDAADAFKSVRDAQVNLDSARLALTKLQQPPDALSLLQAENALTSAKDNLEKLKLSQQINYQATQETKQKAHDNIIKAYEDSFNTIADSFLDLPNIITGLSDILYGTAISQSELSLTDGQQNINALFDSTYINDQPQMQIFIISAENDYNTARTKYDQNFTDYKNTNRYSDEAVIESLLAETLETTKSLAQAAKSVSNMLDAWVDYRSQRRSPIFNQVVEYQADSSTYIGQTSGHLSSILSQQRTLQDNKEAVVNAERDLQQMDQNNPLDLAAAQQSIKEKESALLKLQAGTDVLDIQSQQLTIRQRENALADASQALADYTIRAPFAGVVAELNVKPNDQVSAGSALVILVTEQQVAEISLNEVDVAKIQVGQKATLSFDALEDLSISGSVAEIDTIGTVTQGVVNYNVKIVLDTQDERIKPGMSVSVNIITDIRLDVLLVPGAAVKSQGENQYYVEVMFNGQPQRQVVEIGATSDSATEIISGLKEGDEVVTQTIDQSASASQSSSQQRSLLPGIGGSNIRSFNR